MKSSSPQKRNISKIRSYIRGYPISGFLINNVYCIPTRSCILIISTRVFILFFIPTRAWILSEMNIASQRNQLVIVWIRWWFKLDLKTVRLWSWCCYKTATKIYFIFYSLAGNVMPDAARDHEWNHRLLNLLPAAREDIFIVTWWCGLMESPWLSW